MQIGTRKPKCRQQKVDIKITAIKLNKSMLDMLKENQFKKSTFTAVNYKLTEIRIEIQSILSNPVCERETSTVLIFFLHDEYFKAIDSFALIFIFTLITANFVSRLKSDCFMCGWPLQHNSTLNLSETWHIFIPVQRFVVS